MNAPGELPPAPTVAYAAVAVAHCEHCEADTVQVRGGSGLRHPTFPGVLTRGFVDAACLQCIADGGSCCSLKPLNRWAK